MQFDFPNLECRAPWVRPPQFSPHCQYQHHSDLGLQLETAPQGIEAPKGAQNTLSRSGVRLNFLVFYSTPEALEPFSGKRRGFCSINPLELSKLHPDFIFYEIWVRLIFSVSSTSIANRDRQTDRQTNRQDSENPRLWFLRLTNVKPLRGENPRCLTSQIPQTTGTHRGILLRSHAASVYFLQNYISNLLISSLKSGVMPLTCSRT